MTEPSRNLTPPDDKDDAAWLDVAFAVGLAFRRVLYVMAVLVGALALGFVKGLPWGGGRRRRGWGGRRRRW
jgi:hypothetical protein